MYICEKLCVKNTLEHAIHIPFIHLCRFHRDDESAGLSETHFHREFSRTEFSFGRRDLDLAGETIRSGRRYA